MKTITLELTYEVAKQVLPSLERQHKLLIDQADSIANQIDLIRGGLRKTVVPDLFQSKVTKTENGRSKKGETEKAVVEYLKSTEQQGASITAIAEATGTKYGSVRRILKNLEATKDASETDGLWRWN